MMKKFAACFMIAVLTVTMALSGVMMTVKAQDAEEITVPCEIEYVTGVEDSLNVRSEASMDAEIIGSLRDGEKVLVTGNIAGCRFVKIDFQGMTGYVCAEYLTINEDYYLEDEVIVVDEEIETEEADVIAETVDIVVYPRVDQCITNGSHTTWCTLNTDGCYYNEQGEKYMDLGNGTFCNTLGEEYIIL